MKIPVAKVTHVNTKGRDRRDLYLCPLALNPF